LTPSEALAEALAVADLDPSDANLSAYLDACAAAHVYDGGALALSRRWSRSADDVIRLRREAHQAAGRSLVTPLSR